MTGSLSKLLIHPTKIQNAGLKKHTGIPGLWTQELDAGLWTLGSGRWMLHLGS